MIRIRNLILLHKQATSLKLNSVLNCKTKSYIEPTINILPHMNCWRFLLIILLQFVINSGGAQSFAEVGSKLSLSKLDSSVNGYHWRLWANQGYGVLSVIQIDQASNASFTGKVIVYAVEAVDVQKESPTNRIYSDVVNMKPEQVDKIVTFIKVNHINQIPTDRAIKGWDLGEDGVVYNIEYVDSGRYQNKS